MTRARSSRRARGAADDPAYLPLKSRVIARTGHAYYADKDDLLYDRLAKRWRILGLADAAAYARVLDGPDGAAEWDALEAEITIGETFFFRYAEQFAALKERILPECIAARAGERRLRIWSAGCSTGAEPYSVAILVRELLGDALPHWTVEIVGTDLSAAAIATARRGEYGRWALRTMPAERRAAWFRALPPSPGPMREGGYRLRPEFLRMVRFERGNLMALIERTMPPDFADFDLILCRNVLIYFSAETVLGLIRGFSERLRPDGWILIGHAEPNPAFATWLRPVNLPGTVVYRRADTPQAASVAWVPVPVPEVPPPTPARDPEHPASAALDPLAAIDRPASTEPAAASDADALTRIRALADSGATAQAWRALGAAVKAQPTNARLHFYKGLLAAGFGRDAEAEKALRGALFLDRDFVMAHYQYGLLLVAGGRAQAGRKSLENALRLAEALAPDTPLPEGDGLTAARLVESLRGTPESLRSTPRRMA